MAVHVGKARRKVSASLTVDDLCIRRYRHILADRSDAITLNQYSLILEYLLAIHGNDIYVHERDSPAGKIALCASMAGYGNAG
jgi:hypothetical protein